jgi:MarR family transcriptional regulator, transcriptional regulator for hemolysin
MLYRPFENKLNFHLAEHNLHRAQWSIFYYLFNNGPATLVELSHYLYVEKPTVTRTMNRLEELGYVEQVPSNDKREKRTQLTELGRKVYNQYETAILKGISEHEQLEAIRIMGEIRKNIIK